MPKGLHLKRTPAEQAEHDLRKARRAAKKAALRQRRAQDANFDAKDIDLDYAFLDPGPSTSRRGTRTTGAAEDDNFHEKLFDALGDDDRLDTVEARLNEYAHIPRRWRGAGSQAHEPDCMAGPDDDPRFMDDDEYAEWVRVGMWRRRNAAAHHEQQRQKAAQAAAQAEAARILRVKEDGRRRGREERERRRHADARDTYERRWVGLVESTSADLGFGDVPWPVCGKADISRLTSEGISAFLFPVCLEVEEPDGGKARTRKEELRGTMLRFHPDKFEGRILPRVKKEERDAVREGANAVARAVAALMEAK